MDWDRNHLSSDELPVGDGPAVRPPPGPAAPRELKQPQQTSAIINFVYRFTKTEDKFAIEWITHYLFRRQLT